MLLLVLLMLQLDGAAGSCPDFEDGCSRYFSPSLSPIFFLPLPSTSQLFLPVTRSQVLPPLVSSRYWLCLQLVGYPTQPYFYFLARITSPFLFLFFLNTFLPPARSGISFERRRSMSVCPVSPAAVARRTTQASELHAPTFTPSASAFWNVAPVVAAGLRCQKADDDGLQSRLVSSLHEVWMRWLQCQDTLHSARPFPRCFLARACRDASIFIFFYYFRWHHRRLLITELRMF